MSAVTTALPTPRGATGDGFTVADLAAMPDDGRRYELLDGMLLVSPSPTLVHQRGLSRLIHALMSACPPRVEILAAPFDVRLAEDTLLQPDLVVVDTDAAETHGASARPLLVVEILSASTRLYDLNLKKARYEAAGIPAYWVLDPGLGDRPASLTAWDLHDATYVEIAHVEGEETFTAEHPFPVRIVPSFLTCR